MSYRFGGKQKLLNFGAYPAVSLKDARDRRMEAKTLLAKGIDPGEYKKAAKEAAQAETENSFEIVAREWYNRQKDIWASSHGDKVLARLVNDIFPILGAKPIHSITPPELLKALRQIESRSAIETAHRVLQNCGQIFRYAIATGRAERDIAADLKGALTPYKHRGFATITDPDDISTPERSNTCFRVFGPIPRRSATPPS